MEQKPKLQPAIAALIVIVLVGIVASVAIVVANNSNGDKTTSTTEEFNHETHQHAPSDDPTVDSTDISEYKDGTYSATGTYLSPGGRESIELTVTIKDGVITDTSLVKNATSTEAKEYQGHFEHSYKELVIGKKVNGLSLTRVAGSSLTSGGFNEALDEIRDDARA